MNTQLPNVPLIDAATTKHNTENNDNTFIVPFLLGVIAGKACLNHKFRRIALHFSLSKLSMAQKLKEYFGGCVYEKCRGDYSYSCYEVRSKKAMQKLQEVVRSQLGTLPLDYLTNLDDFLTSAISK